MVKASIMMLWFLARKDRRRRNGPSREFGTSGKCVSTIGLYVVIASLSDIDVKSRDENVERAVLALLKEQISTESNAPPPVDGHWSVEIRVGI
tara:strand:+ start:476 stop:754 length:279 start_codon:yes stop_codon:yes gene_type:complete